MEEEVPIDIVRISDNAKIPTYGSEKSNGADLYSAEPGVVTIPPGERRLIKTGVAIDMPLGVFGFVTPRSGLAMKYGVTALNAPGLIDTDYHGEIGVILINLSGDVYEVHPDDRIAQLVFMDQRCFTFNEVDELRTETNRGTKGFGSTGK